jgi:hypothetical protein
MESTADAVASREAGPEKKHRPMSGMKRCYSISQLAVIICDATLRGRNRVSFNNGVV